MTELEKQFEVAKQVIKELAADSEHMCDYCKYNIPCLGEKCEFYESGVGMYDESGKYFDWKWSCMDFDFGTCEKLKDMPCSSCFTINGESKFEWNGKARGSFKVD